MAGYPSRLKVVINARKTRQEVIHRELVVEKERLLKAEGVKRRLSDAYEAALDGLRQGQQGNATPAEMGLYYQFVQVQAQKMEAQQNLIRDLEAVYEAKRGALEIATREKVMLETIEEKRKQAYMGELRKKESDLLDELAGQMKWRMS